MSREVTNPGSAVGEAIGKLIEADLTAAVRESPNRSTIR
jgi:hypothetical protein